MEIMLIMVVIGIILGVGGTFGIRKLFYKKRDQKKNTRYQIYLFVEHMKSVAELVVLKAFTKEIVTAADHWLGELGKRYLTWLMSNMKLAMVFQFEINFWYDLKSPAFTVTDGGDGRFIITMPQCLYDISIKNIRFYDEQSARLLHWLLPPLISRVFSRDFSQEERNKLIDEAKMQASLMADQLVKGLRPDIEKSARQTMEALAKSFGAKSVVLDFSKAQFVEGSVTDITQQQVAEA